MRRLLDLIALRSFALAAVCPGLPGVVLAIGGDDVRVSRFVDGTDIFPGHGICRLAASETGELLATVGLGLTDTRVRVFRSTDGGSDWTQWGDIDAIFLPDGLDAALAPGTPDRFVVVRTEPGDVLVHSAELADLTPTFSSTNVGSPEPSGASVSIAAFDGGAVAADVYLAYISDNDEIMFALSQDGGVTFAAPIVLEILDPDLHYALDLAADASNQVRLAWTENDSDVDIVTVYYREASNDGAVIGDWAARDVLEVVNSFQSGQAPITIAASPIDNDLLVAAETAFGGDVRLYHSPDAGNTWNQFDVLEDAGIPDLTWGSAGPALACEINTPTQAYCIARPSTADPASPWVNEAVLDVQGQPAIRGTAITSDPTRGDEFAILGSSSEFDVFLGELWFDAEWRDAPGYGLSEAGTPVDVGATITSAPAIADLESDGDEDVVFTLSDSTVAAFDLAAGILTSFGAIGPTSPSSAPVVANFLDDAAREIFVGLDNGEVAGLSAFGAPLLGWPVDLGTNAPVYASAGVLTGQARLELVAASGNQVFLLRPDGSTVPGFPFVGDVAWGDVVGRVAVGDLDDDGDAELVATFAGQVVALDDAGQVLWTIYNQAALMSAGVTLGDVDNDGDLEVALPLSTGVVGLRHHTGTPYGSGFPYSTGSTSPVGPISLCASGTTAAPYFHFVNLAGQAFVIDLIGSPRPSFPESTPAGVTLREAIIDHLGPGAGPLEMLVGTPDGDAELWDTGNSVDVDGWRRDVWEPVDVACAAADLEGDGLVEAVIPAGSRLWVLDMGVAPAPVARTWGQAGGDPRRSACWGCEAVIPTEAGETTRPLDRPSLTLGPNPARSSEAVTLRFSAPGAGVAHAALYDAAGRLVRTIATKAPFGDTGTLQWDGLDDSGKVVSSGVYWIQLRLESEHRTGSTTLVRPVTRLR